MMTHPLLWWPTPSSRNSSAAFSMVSFEGGSGIERIDRASSAFGLIVKR
jgi:hypothetical protein